MKNDDIPFDVHDYVSNPIALERIKKNITQKELAMRMNVTQAYISKLEGQEVISAKVMTKVKNAFKKVKKK